MDHSPARFSFLAMTALSLALLAPESKTFGQETPVEKQTKLTDPADDRAIALAHDLSGAFQKVAKNVTPAVVNITATKTPQRGQGDMNDFFGGFNRPQTETSTGSGIVVTADGYILTNNHVVEGATNLQVMLSDNRTFQASLVGRDPETDVAVLKLDGKGFTFAPLGNSDAVAVGEWVVAIGNPFGLNQTVTAGIISAKGRTLGGPQQRRMAQPNRYEDFLQTDAAINPGNSGGALVNLEGKVIGMNTAIFSRSGGYMGIGFAIPSNMAKSVLDSLIATGSVQRGWIGVSIQQLDETTARTLNYPLNEGVVIAQIVPGGPADKAGIQVEDIVTAIDGRAIVSDNSFRNIVATLPPGRAINLDLFRAGKRIALNATIAKRDDEAAAAQAQAAQAAAVPDNALGLSGMPLTPELAAKSGLTRARGILITRVRSDGPAVQFIRPADVILRIDGKDVNSLQDFNAAANAINLRKGVRIVLSRDGTQSLLTLSTRE
ncbi:DegQ family serine endoprotease [soil metagenome]